jgi:hypothetical protein
VIVADEEESVPLEDLRADIEDDDAEERDRDTQAPSEAAGEEAASDETDSIPLSGLRDEVDRQSREERNREDAVAEGAFAEESVEPVDSEGVWADLLMDDGSPEGHFEAREFEAGAEGPTQVISKRICERCRYLAAPPVLECTHEGTTIHELVDVAHVRVSECPMVGPDGEKTTPGETPPETN